MNKKLSLCFFYLSFVFSLMFCFLPMNTYSIDVSNMVIEENSDGKLQVKNVTPVDDANKTAKHQKNYMEERYGRYITVLAFITAIAAITMLAIFIKHIIHLAALGTEHWIVRRNAMIGLLWSGIATALLGSATLIMALAYNAFQL